jgi:hypothetical protein
MALFYSFSSVVLLCFTTSLLVAVVNGTSPFYGRPGPLAESRSGFFNRYYENAAARSMQVLGDCAVSGTHEICHTADLQVNGLADFQVHICPTDGKIL